MSEGNPRAWLEATDRAHHLPAGTLYTGRQHRALMEGVGAVRAPSSGHPLEVEVAIVSAGFGLVAEETPLPPYECTFTGMGTRPRRAWAEALGLPEAVYAWLGAPAALTLVLLGDHYLDACALRPDQPLGGPTLFFASSTAAPHLPAGPNARTLALSNSHARRYGEGLVWLKGTLAARVLRALHHGAVSVATLIDPVFDLYGALDAWALEALDPDIQYVAEPPPAWYAQSHARPLKFFMPDWDDLVDPDFNFAQESYARGRGGYFTEVFSHQLYRATGPNYDGLLVSRAVLEKNARKRRLLDAFSTRGGVHAYLRIPHDVPVLGDCGAFSYVTEDTPPYDTAEVLDYYDRYGFDFGISVDHLAVGAPTPEKRGHRYDLTLRNAEAFVTGHRAAGYAYTPIAGVQGWDPPSYRAAAQACVAMGYDYLALGGLVRARTPEIIAAVEAVRGAVSAEVRLHVLGFGRLEAVPDLLRLGVTSIDTASYLRRAWTDATHNYMTRDGKVYTALRIPAAKEKQGAVLEREALNAVRHYDASPSAVQRSAALEALLVYAESTHLGSAARLRPAYEATLHDRPWQVCGCAVCRDAGVEVILFRGNNRNRRRGFHNTHVFYERLGAYLHGELQKPLGFTYVGAAVPSPLPLFEGLGT